MANLLRSAPGRGDTLRHHILVVDDDESVLRSICRVLRREFEVSGTSKPTEAVALCESTRFDAVVTDLEMPELDGLHLIARIRAAIPGGAIPIVVFTGTSVIAVKGADRVLHKPGDVTQLLSAVKGVIADANASPAEPGPVRRRLPSVG